MQRVHDVEGVFPHLVDEAAILDKVAIAVWGSRRTRCPLLLKKLGNVAIGGNRSFYARCERFQHSVSGNSGQLVYGRMRPFENLPPYVLTMWAGGSPLTCADVLRVLDGFFRRGYRAIVSRVELTFDTALFSQWHFDRELCCRANVSEFNNGRGERTVYVGGTKGPWQGRIYQKTTSIARVEFILRKQFLRQHGIRTPQDLLLLKAVDLWKLVGFHTVIEGEDHALPPRIRKPWAARGLLLSPVIPAPIIEDILRDAHVDPRPWIARSKREILLRGMQERLIW